MKEKLNFTLDPECVDLIDEYAKDIKISRSAALNYILHSYLVSRECKESIYRNAASIAIDELKEDGIISQEAASEFFNRFNDYSSR